MIYGSLISLLLVILILTTGEVPALPQLDSPLLTAAAIFAKFIAFILIAWSLARKKASAPAVFSRLETRLNILAIVVFACDVYLLGLKRLLAAIPLSRAFPSIMDLAGVGVFHLYLIVVWLVLRPVYARTFGVSPSRWTFLASRLKFNLSLVLPWIVFSFVYDGLDFLPAGHLRAILSSWWGGMVFFVAVFVAVATVFPLVLVRLWNCSALPSGEEREMLAAMAKRCGLRVREICLWPLMEGRVLTAAVMGLVRRARFLLVTPALLETLSPAELEAVVAHEAGHVRYRHLWLYFLFFLGFAFIAQGLMPIAIFFIVGADFFYQMVSMANADPAEMLDFLGSVPLFVVLILYFRYVFGFFMRNFEREADLAAMDTVGSSRPLVSVLEKIALSAGNIREESNWHHFGIGERVEFLLRAENDRRVGARHHLKVKVCLAAFVLSIAGGIFLYSRAMPRIALSDSARFSEAVVSHRLKLEPDNPLWLQLYADLLQDRGRDGEAIAAYERALAVAPDNGDLLNNLAWLFLTARAPWLRDDKRALVLAKKAVDIKPQGYTYDTLALAYWRNGRAAEAVKNEEKAQALDPQESDYYQSQIRRFGGEEG